MLTKQAREENCSCTKDFGGRARRSSLQPKAVGTLSTPAESKLLFLQMVVRRLDVNEHITTAICGDKCKCGVQQLQNAGLMK